MRRIVGINLAALLLCLACNTSTKPSFEDGNTAKSSIAHLKTLCRGTSTIIDREISIEGIITANDIRGEFPQTLILEDASGGIEVSVDSRALADLFPLGAAVTIHCTGLALGEYGGKVRLGAPPTGSYSVDRIPRTEISRYIRCTQLNAMTRSPRRLTISQIGLPETDIYVRIDEVRFAETDAAWCNSDPETGELLPTRRTLTDAQGNNLTVRTSPECHYATEPVPIGTGSVNGIIDYFNGEYSLRIVNYEINFSTSAMRSTAYPSIAGCSAPTPTR